MLPNAQADRPAIPAVDGGLTPAELQALLRQRLGRLAGAWGLDQEDMQRLAEQAYTQTYAAGQLILPHRVRPDFLAFLVRGQVGAYLGQQRSARRVAVLQPGSSFGDLGPVKGRPADTALRALTACEISILRRADLEALVVQRQAEQRRRQRWRPLLGGVLLLLAALALAFAFRQPAVQRAAAVVPLAVGQWCSEQGGGQAYDRCSHWAWALAAGLAPTDAGPRLSLGTLYARRGEWAAAERSFEAARALAPDWAEVYNNLGVIYAQQGDHARAVPAFEQALLLEPGTATVERNLGLSLQALQSYDEALAHYELALAFGEGDPGVLVNMALAYYETGQLDRAKEMARQALRGQEAPPPAYMVLGAVALRSGMPEPALSYLQQAAALDPGLHQAYYYSGLAYRDLDRPAEAIAAFEQALAGAEAEETRVEIRRHLQALYEMQQQAAPP